MKRSNPEELEIKAYLEWMHLQHSDIIVFKIQNEGKRNPLTAKKIGIVAGMPDLCILKPIGNWHGLFIEMKRQDGRGRVSAAQEALMEKINKENYYCSVCFGWQSAKLITENYLSNNYLLLLQ